MSELSIVKREVRFAVHIPRTENNEDTHYVKEQVTYSDGTRVPKISLITDYMRPVFVTRENCRDHIEKKEFEHMERLIKRECTDSDLYRVAANMLGDDFLAKNPRKIRQSPWVWGLDITAANMIKLESLQRNDFVQSPYSVATFDIETKLDSDHILVASLAREVGDKLEIYAVIDNEWVKTVPNIENKIRARYAEAYPEYVDNTNIEMKFHEDELDMLKDIFLVANKWAPDFLSIWNINFDLNEVILSVFKRRGVRPEDYICDPRLPPELKKFKFIEGKDVFVTASGVTKRMAPAERWHKVYCTSTFQFIDAMCTYRGLRLHKAKEASYSLNNILDLEIKSSKLFTQACSNLTGASWHSEMQKSYIPEYIAYNFGDNIEPLKLDKHTKDLSTSLPIFAEITDFNDFGSSNKKAYTSLFIFGLSRDMVIGVGCDMRDVENELLKQGHELYKYSPLDVDGWIQTLPQDNRLDNGLSPFTDYACLITNTRGNVVDMDSVSSYPSCTIAANVSKATCVSEPIEVNGFSQQYTKDMFLGTIIGNTNALETGHVVFNLPSAEELMKMIMNGEI